MDIIQLFQYRQLILFYLQKKDVKNKFRKICQLPMSKNQKLNLLVFDRLIVICLEIAFKNTALVIALLNKINDYYKS